MELPAGTLLSVYMPLLFAVALPPLYVATAPASGIMVLSFTTCPVMVPPFVPGGDAVSAKFWVTIAPFATLAVAVEGLNPAAEAPS